MPLPASAFPLINGPRTAAGRCTGVGRVVCKVLQSPACPCVEWAAREPRSWVRLEVGYQALIQQWAVRSLWSLRENEHHSLSFALSCALWALSPGGHSGAGV